MNKLYSFNGSIRLCVLSIAALVVICSAHSTTSLIAETRSRVIFMADMGHDPDEEQQMTHMLMCSNEFEVEGLIAVTGRFFRKDPKQSVKDLRPELFRKLIDGYERIYPNLKLHADGWHSPQHLRSIVFRGQEGNGMGDVRVGHSSSGAKHVIAVATKNDPRPLYIIINAGANTLAQALLDYRENHTEAETAALIAKLRVYDNGGQDNAGAWICHHFPDLHYIRSLNQTRAYGGPSNKELGPYCWEPYPYTPEGQHKWTEENIQKNHGSLGALYPNRGYDPNNLLYMEGGGTVPFLRFVSRGLTDPSEPSWGGWSGRYSAEKQDNVLSHFGIVHANEKKFLPFKAYAERNVSDSWTDPRTGKDYNSVYAGVWRWRQAAMNNFKARMDWCVQPYDKANHHPVASIGQDSSNEIIRLTSKVGDQHTFDASASTDPDGDTLRYKWWNYPEAGAKPYGETLPIEGADSAKIEFRIPADAQGKQLHLILEVWDENEIVPLVDYRRIVIDVE